MDAQEFDIALTDLETRVDRLRALYENWFRGYEKSEPAVARKDAERRVYGLRKELPRNTALRFRYHQLYQRYTTLANYWQRTARQIEEGTYRLQLQRVKRKRADDPAARRSTLKDGDEAEAAADRGYALDLDETLDVNKLLGDLDLGELGRALDEPSPAVALPTPELKPEPARPMARFARPSQADASHRGKPPEGARSVLLSSAAGDQAPPLQTPVPPRPALAQPSRAPLASAPLAGASGRAPSSDAKPAPLKIPPLAPPALLKPSLPQSPSLLGSPEGPRASMSPPKVPPPPGLVTGVPRPPPPTGVSMSPPRPPAAVARVAEPAKQTAPADALGEPRLRRLYDEYAAARRKNNEGEVRYETLATSIEKMLPELRKKHAGKQIDFEIVLKDGRVGLKPKAT
jgi:hypothetical protein